MFSGQSYQLNPSLVVTFAGDGVRAHLPADDKRFRLDAQALELMAALSDKSRERLNRLSEIYDGESLDRSVQALVNAGIVVPEDGAVNGSDAVGATGRPDLRQARDHRDLRDPGARVRQLPVRQEHGRTDPGGRGRRRVRPGVAGGERRSWAVLHDRKTRLFMVCVTPSCFFHSTQPLIAVSIAAMVVFSAGIALFYPSSSSALLDMAPRHLSGQYLAAYQAVFGLAYVIGPPVLLWELQKNMALPWLMLAILSLLGAAGQARIRLAG